MVISEGQIATINHVARRLLGVGKYEVQGGKAALRLRKKTKSYREA